MESNYLSPRMQTHNANSESFRRKTPRLPLFGLCLWLASIATCPQASYLDEIEAEAEISTKDKLAQPKQETERKKLESMLKNQQPGTYAFYKKLTIINKAEVIKSYKAAENLTHIKKQIFDLYFAQDK
jgi:hypothetical protein